MSIRSNKLLVALLAGLMVLAFARCGEGETDPDANTKKDGGPPPSKADAGTTPPDGGYKPVPAIETTVPAINNLEAEDHPAVNKKVTFKAVVMSPVWRLNAGDKTCLYGIYVADANADPEYNGILVVSKSSVTSGKCNLDSQLHKVGSISVGDEVEVLGFYNEYCYKPSGSQGCLDQYEGKGISLVQIAANMDGDIKLTGEKPGVPAGLPVTVRIDDIYSTKDSSGAITGLGENWWKYRTVLVRLENVKVVDDNGPSFNWTVAPKDAEGPTLIVNDDAMFDGKDHSPATGTELNSLTGFVYWTFSDTQLSPRSVDDADPKLPSITPEPKQ